MISRRRIEEIERDFIAAEIAGHISLDHAICITPDDFSTPRYESFLREFRQWRREHPAETAMLFGMKRPEHFDLAIELSSHAPANAHVYELMGDVAIEKHIEAALRATETLPGLDRMHAIQAALTGMHRIVPDSLGDFEGSSEEFAAWIDADGLPQFVTGHVTLDALVRFEPGQLVIIAGSPSAGKSSLALDTLKRFAISGLRAEILTLEMRAILLRRRLIANETGVAVNVIARREFGPATRRQLLDANTALDKIPLKLTAAANWDVDRVTDRIMRSPAEVIAIDYVGLVESSKNSNQKEPQAVRVARISRAIMQATVASGKLVLLLSQLNREGYADQSKPPAMHNLKDSGALEADANTIIGMHCPPSDRDRAVRPVRVEVLKNRDGETSEHVMFDFFAPVSRFAEQGAAESFHHIPHHARAENAPETRELIHSNDLPF